MSSSTDPYIRRTAAAQKTLDAWSKRSLKLGTSDCVRMIATHLRLLGYKVKLPASGSYGTYASAAKALKAAGFASIDEALDAMRLERIAPAAAAVGDIVKLPADHPIGCFTVALGNGRVVGFHEEAKTAATLQPLEYAGAWRVEPR